MKNLTRYVRISVAATLAFSLLPLQVFALAPREITEIKINEAQKAFSFELEQKKQDILTKAEEKKASVKFKSNRIVVKYKNDKKPFRIINLPDNTDVLETVKKYTSYSNIEYAEPDFMAYADFVPNDPYYSPYQWHIDNANDSGINAEEAWDISTGSNVIVAVIDTGIAYENYYQYYRAPDLADTCFVQGYDFINNDTHPNDDNNHGTHVAGTIAQSTNNGTGVAGVAHDACLMPVKALDRRGGGSYTAIANAIYYAVDNGAQVINMSLGGSSDSSTLENAVAYAYNNGVTVIAAAGNSNTTAPHYPSSYNEYVISVGATDYNKDRAPYSNYGPDIDVVAPGGDTGEDSNGDGYVDGVLQQTFVSSYRLNRFGYYFFQGTSMASPHVAGTAALLISNGNATTPDDIQTALESTTQDLGTTGRDDIFGHGLIDAAAALGWNSGPVNEAPVVTLDTLPEIITGTVIVSAVASDNDGSIASVVFTAGSIEYTATTEPYSFDWDTTLETDGDHTIVAVATDNLGATADDSMTVTVDNINDAPVADAGADQTVSDIDGNGSETVTLDGSTSYDPDGTIASYEWKDEATVIATSPIATISSNVGVHPYTLTVTDDDGAIDTDTVTITVNPNQPPTADAGDDQTVMLGTAVSFDASGSSDDGSIISYDWDFGDGNTGSGVTTSHIYATSELYTVTLTVTDDAGATGTDSLTVIVEETPSETEVFYDSFEISEWNGNWTEDYQNDWARRSQRASEGSYSAEVDGYAKNATLTSKKINLTEYTNATITFDWFIEYGLDYGEYLAFDISVDDGTWTEYAQLKGNVNTENVWRTETIEVSDLNTLKLRFRGKMSRSNEDAFVDNVRVIAN